MLIDIHSHQFTLSSKYSILNLSENFENIPIKGMFSAGLHPWYIKINTFRTEIAQLTNALKNKNVIAVGECGLDKACSTDFQLQMDCFKQQIRLAKLLRKPLIIHCVRAFSETIQMLEQEQCKVPVIFHGFTKGAVIAKQLISKGYYLSFGRHLLDSKIASVFEALPLANIFFETDDEEISIMKIYQTAASIKKISVESISTQIKSNAGVVFSHQQFF